MRVSQPQLLLGIIVCDFPEKEEKLFRGKRNWH